MSPGAAPHPFYEDSSVILPPKIQGEIDVIVPSGPTQWASGPAGEGPCSATCSPAEEGIGGAPPQPRPALSFPGRQGAAFSRWALMMLGLDATIDQLLIHQELPVLFSFFFFLCCSSIYLA